MAIFVITIHTSPFENVKNEIFQKIYGAIVSSAVPFFFMSSGFLVFNETENLYDIKIWRYLSKIIKLYFIWTLIYMPLTIYDYVKNNNSLTYNILLFIRGLFFIGEHYNSWILWYLLSLIYSLLLINILIKCKIRIQVIYLISVLLFVFANVMTALINKIDSLDGFIRTLAQYFQYAFSSGRLFTGMFYIMTGIIISRYKNNIYILLSIGVMLFFGNIFMQELYSSISVAVYSIIIFLLIIHVNFNENKIFRKLREASTVFYFTHMILWSIYTIIILKKPDHHGIDSFIFSLIGCIIISLVFIKLKERACPTARLAGKSRAAR
jgi:surface polysaccharide O-acyltransferase-like enzyme